ncbi:MAG: PaaI family thioesterase [Proteobacteria bacterium]|nr:PaaI family thioesterase [Pseudomonadota bacterium]
MSPSALQPDRCEVAWLDQLEPGCLRLLRPPGALAGATFFVETPDDRVTVRYALRSADRAVLGRVWLGPASQGPPGHAHGGAVAALLDEAMGAVAYLRRGCAVLTARLEVDFLRPLPVRRGALLEATVVEEDGRKLITRARLLNEAHHEVARAQGLYLEPRTPIAWRPFALEASA